MRASGTPQSPQHELESVPGGENRGRGSVLAAVAVGAVVLDYFVVKTGAVQSLVDSVVANFKSGGT